MISFSQILTYIELYRDQMNIYLQPKVKIQICINFGSRFKLSNVIRNFSSWPLNFVIKMYIICMWNSENGQSFELQLRFYVLNYCG